MNKKEFLELLKKETANGNYLYHPNMLRRVGSNASLLIGWLTRYAEKNSENAEDWFKCSNKDILKEIPFFSNYKITRALQIMEAEKIIRRRTEGFPGVRKIKINFENLLKA